MPLGSLELQQEWVISYGLAKGDRRPRTLASSALNQAMPLEMSLETPKRKNSVRRGCAATGKMKGLRCEMTVQPCLQCVMAHGDISKGQRCHPFQVNTKISCYVTILPVCTWYLNLYKKKGWYPVYFHSERGKKLLCLRSYLKFFPSIGLCKGFWRKLVFQC